MSLTNTWLRKQLGVQPISKEREGRAVRKIIAGCSIIEAGIMEVQDDAKVELKQRGNNTIKWARSVVQWFIGHPNATIEHKERFKEDYHNYERSTMLAELFDTVADLNPDDLEMIIESIKQHIDEKKGNDTTEQN